MSFSILPIELIQRIADELPAKFVFTVMRSINRRCYGGLTDPVYWRQRFQRYKLLLPVLKHKPLQAVQLCFDVEIETNFWNRYNDNQSAFDASYLVPHYNTVDAIAFITVDKHDFFITASRDRCIRIFSTFDTTLPVTVIPNAHNSWINTLMPICCGNQPSLFISTGFDGSLRLWKLPDTKNSNTCLPLTKLSLKSTVVDSASSISIDGRIYFLCADNCIRFITFNSNPPSFTPSGRLTYFKSQSLAIAMGYDESTAQTFLYLSSRSKWIVALECTHFTKKVATQLDSEAICMQSANSRIYCGLKNGDIIMLTLDLMLLKVINTFNTTIGVSTLTLSTAHLISTSGDGTICVFSLKDELFHEVCRKRVAASFSAVQFKHGKFGFALADNSVFLVY